MLSSPLAGILRVGVVLLAAGALAGGVYLLAQADDERTASSLEAPTAIAAAPGPLSPPADIGTPPAIDTSNWLKYSSTYGYSFSYPPDWILLEFPETDSPVPDGQPGQSIWLMNPAFENARRIALAERGGLPGGFEPPARSVKVEINVLPTGPVVGGHFDAASFSEFCENNIVPPEHLRGATLRALEGAAAGRQAVHCLPIAATIGDLEAPALTVWFELAEKRTLRINPRMVQPTAEEAAQVLSIVASILFEPAP